MRLLITGICGFAGSAIARELLAHQPGLTIIGLDSLIRRGSETNVEPLRALGIDVRISDIRDRATIEALPAVDWIIDCAANPSVLAGVDGRTSSQDLLDHNLAGTLPIFAALRSAAGNTSSSIFPRPWPAFTRYQLVALAARLADPVSVDRRGDLFA
jgi:CDP-paratose 2-epimerase